MLRYDAKMNENGGYSEGETARQLRMKYRYQKQFLLDKFYTY